MNFATAIDALGALAQEHRLKTFRVLLQRGPSGVTAGEIAQRLGIAASALSFHLSHLERAGLLKSWRIKRNVYYAVDLDGARRLMTFLSADCCRTHPEICDGLIQFPSHPVSQEIRNMEAMEAMEDKVYNILFLCTGNSARSIMAECILNRLGAGKFKGYSAGSLPKGRIHPFAIELLKNLNHSTDDLRSKSWDEFSTDDAPQVDFVFTLCDDAASEVCPVWPGQPMNAHWGLPDPAAVDGNDAEKHAAFADAYRMLNNRIDIFINLPMESLDRMTLQKRLDHIGQMKPEPAMA